MDWQGRMNQAMDYIEKHLEGAIDCAVLAQYMNCSPTEFRRLFSFLTQLPLSEYIRRRRLTRAATDIRAGDRILDVSLRYGYESQAAFSRAFRRLHGTTPLLARDPHTLLKPYPRLTFKLVLMEGICMDQQHLNHRPNIIGAGEVGCAISTAPNRRNIHKTNTLFWDETGSDVLGLTALPHYGAFISEDTCHLLGDLHGKKALDIGCGRGQSMLYLSQRGAGEIWGLDISQEQLDKARQLLSEHHVPAHLLCAPMEEDCGLPKDYFDLVYSVYGIGWTTELETTFRHIASYLKPDGRFVFSWSHPIHKCVAADDGVLQFKKNYFDESWYTVAVGDGTLSLSDRKLSTYLNALAHTGFVLEELVEQNDDGLLCGDHSAFAQKARMLPVTFAVKARKA